MNLPAELITHIALNFTPFPTLSKVRQCSKRTSTLITPRDLARIESRRLFRRYGTPAITKAVCAPTGTGSLSEWEDRTATSPLTPATPKWGSWSTVAVGSEMVTPPIGVGVGALDFPFVVMPTKGAKPRRRVAPSVMPHLLHFLIEMGADPNSPDGPAIRGAIESGDVDCLTWLIRIGACSEYLCTEGISWAAMAGRADMVQVLLREGQAGKCNWALYIAAEDGHLGVVDVLLKASNSLIWADQELQAARTAAQTKGYGDVVRRLDTELACRSFMGLSDITVGMARVVLAY